ncbi:MAG: hypothetical protein ACKOB5_07755 [Betaproteobacteria bacterium]
MRLLGRVCDIDIERCPNCGVGELKIIAAILERPVIKKILSHLGLDPPFEIPMRACRGSCIRVAHTCLAPGRRIQCRRHPGDSCMHHRNDRRRFVTASAGLALRAWAGAHRA